MWTGHEGKFAEKEKRKIGALLFGEQTGFVTGQTEFLADLPNY